MEFNEELLTDEGYRRLNALQQYELIAEHCREIEERIRTAPSQQEARRIADAACARLNESCRSTLVKKALAANVENLIARHWLAQAQEQRRRSDASSTAAFVPVPDDRPK